MKFKKKGFTQLLLPHTQPPQTTTKKKLFPLSLKVVTTSQALNGSHQDARPPNCVTKGSSWCEHQLSIVVVLVTTLEWLSPKTKQIELCRFTLPSPSLQQLEETPYGDRDVRGANQNTTTGNLSRESD